MDLDGSSQLITIGEFARLGGVSIKALRIYAAIGLLQPSRINPKTRYRLYSRAQLSKLHRILMLKNAGLPLSQIGSQLSNRDETALSRIRAILMSRAEEIQQQLAWIDAEIQASAGRANGVVPVVVKHAPEMHILSQRRRIDSYEEADHMLCHLASAATKPVRLVSGAIWHDCGAATRIIDCEVFWVLNRPVHGGVIKVLPKTTMASILHAGDEAAIGESYEAARRWIADNHYEVAGPNREIYLCGSENPGAALIEVQFPIKERQ